jgi:hypothetical protein
MTTKLFKNLGAALLVVLSTFGNTAQAAWNPLTRTEAYAKFSLDFDNNFAQPGFSLGIDTPIGGKGIGEYLRLGGAFTGHFILGVATLDIDAQLRPQIPIRVGQGHLAVYANVPLGLSIVSGPARTLFGIHYGFVPGVRYYFTEQWGVAMELGLNLHTHFVNIPNYGALSVTSPSGIWNAGFMFAF